MAVSRLDNTLEEIVDSGFEIVHREDDQVVVRHVEDEFNVVLTASDEWVQAQQTLLESTEFSERKAAIAELAMQIHGRFLGCRFGFDERGDLVAQCDVYPETAGGQVATALAQLAYVAASALPLFNACAAGTDVGEEQIDLALEFVPEVDSPT